MKKYIPFILAAIAVACEPTELDKGDAVLTTGDAIEITSSSAYLCGEIVSSQPCSVWFELSPDSTMTDSWTTGSTILESEDQSTEVMLSAVKLNPNTTYYYRLCGKIVYDGYYMLARKGEIRSFTTDKYPPAKAKIYLNSPSGDDFVDYFVVENGEVVERSPRHLLDGYDSSRELRYINTTAAISNADIYMCQLTDTDLSDYRSVSFNLKNGRPFYYGHTTVSSMEPEAVCEMRPATCQVRFNVTCKPQNGYVDDGNIYQMSLVNSEGGKTLPISSSAICDLSTGHVTGTSDAKATVSTYANVWLNSNDTQKASFPAVIPATAGEGEAELWFYVKSQNVQSPIKKVMPAFEWSAGNTYTYEITLYYTPQTVELVIGSCTITPWDEEQYIDDLSISELNTDNHEYVDLGLSVKWATCNVGATKPEEYGDYFAWGETKPKPDYSWSTYKYYKGSNVTKYCGSSFGTVDNKTTLELSDDAAYVNWGGNWRMPTAAEIYELLDNCTWTWTTLNGVNGYKVTSKKAGYSDMSIFLPAAGYRYDTSLSYAGSYGGYWSSSLDESDSCNARNFYFDSDRHSTGLSGRYYGRSVRPVFR